MPKSYEALASLVRTIIKDGQRVPKPTSGPGGGTDKKVKDGIFSTLYGSSAVGSRGSKALDSLGITDGVPPIQALRCKAAIRERKWQYISRSGQSGRRLNNVITTFSRILGRSKVLWMLEKLGRGAGEKEHASLINISVDEATRSNNENQVSRCSSNADQCVKAMKEQGS